MADFFVKRKVGDIEDIAKPKFVPVQPQAKITLNEQKSVVAEPELKIEDCPSPDTDFKTWLKF